MLKTFLWIHHLYFALAVSERKQGQKAALLHIFKSHRIDILKLKLYKTYPIYYQNSSVSDILQQLIWWCISVSVARRPAPVRSRWNWSAPMALSSSTATPWWRHAAAANQNAHWEQHPIHSTAEDADQLQPVLHCTWTWKHGASCHCFIAQPISSTTCYSDVNFLQLSITWMVIIKIIFLQYMHLCHIATGEWWILRKKLQRSHQDILSNCTFWRSTPFEWLMKTSSKKELK